jgi:PPOX class probable FMN-dependent enzyme
LDGTSEPKGAGVIASIEALRAIYPAAKERSLLKQLDRLDPICRKFIGMAPFCVIASSGAAGDLDASPRGGAPGFVRVVDDHTMLVPDALGNNRLDTLTNVVETGRIGMIFFVPGVDETLRINGTARLRNDPALLGQFSGERHPPRAVIEVRVKDAYLHCAKALMRSKLWDPTRRVERGVLPSMSQMIQAQTGGKLAHVETQDEMLARYEKEL